MKHRKFAYTLAEVLFTITAISLTSVGLLEGLANLNNYASMNRLNTLATSIVEGQIDCALRETPFNPPTSIPSALVSSTATVPVYTDPPTNITLITGTMATIVTGTGVPVNSGSGSASVTVYNIQTSLTYRYLNATYTVRMSALRSPDVSD